MHARRSSIAAGVGLAIAATAVAAPSQAIEPGYYSVAYDDTILLHEHGDGGAESTRYVHYQEWAAAGFPAPTPAPVDYVKYAWWPDVSAVHFFGPDPEDWVWASLNYDMWSRAGHPSVRNADWIDLTSVIRYATSDEVFFGQPTDFGPGRHKVTYAQWVAAGSPAPELSTSGFYTYPWSDGIGLVWDDGSGEHRDYDQWAYDGFPTPQTVTNVEGEVVWKRAGSSTLYLDSPITGNGVALTPAQWAALGWPAPVVR